MKETKVKVYVDELPEDCKDCPCCSCELKPEFIKIGDFMYCNLLKQKFRYKEERKKLKDCPLKSLHDYKKELVAKVLGMVRENLKEELLLTKNENQEEAKLKLVKTYSIDLDVLNKIEKEILNGYTKI